MRRTATGSACTSWPQIRAVPAVGVMKPVIIRMVVDLPAPLGPRKPSTSPRATLKRHVVDGGEAGPKRLVRRSISISATTFPPYAPPRRAGGNSAFRQDCNRVRCGDEAGLTAPQGPAQPPADRASARATVSGSAAMTRSRVAAGPDGTRCPCSYSRMVSTLKP